MSILQTITNVINGNDPADRKPLQRTFREELARLGLGQRKVDELAVRIAGFDQRADAAATKHSAICLPLQDELRQVEKRIIGNVADRLPADPADEARRIELVNQLAAENETLAREIRAIDEMRETVRNERETLRNSLPPRNVIESKLCGEDVADEALLDQMVVAGGALKYQIARVEAAREKLDRAKSKMQEMRQESIETRRRIDPNSEKFVERMIRRCGLVLAAAVKDRDALQAQVDSIRRKMITGE